MVYENVHGGHTYASNIDSIIYVIITLIFPQMYYLLKSILIKEIYISLTKKIKFGKILIWVLNLSIASWCVLYKYLKDSKIISD